MTDYIKDIMQDIIDKRTSYAEMVEFCADDLILNNYIQNALENAGYYFDIYCGDFYEADDEDQQYPAEVYQQYIITSQAADRFAQYTNEIVMYNEECDIYLLCVTHYGTSWTGVPANWKNIDEI